MMTQTVHRIFYEPQVDSLHLDFHRYKGNKLLGPTMSGHWNGSREVAPSQRDYDQYVQWLVSTARGLVEDEEGELWAELGVDDIRLKLIKIEWYRTADNYAKHGEIGVWVQFHRLAADGTDLHLNSYSNYLLEIREEPPGQLRALLNSKQFIDDWQAQSAKLFEALRRAEAITKALDQRAGWSIAEKR